MEQTFQDLYRERCEAKEGVFGFVVSTFLETTIGVLQEHVESMQEMGYMKNIITNFRSPALIGFLIVLPFIVLELTVVIFKRLTFDMRDALNSVVIFGILWLGVTAILFIVKPLVQSLREGKQGVVDTVPAPGNRLLTDPVSAAILGFVLALPFLTILSLLLLNIEPPFAHLLNGSNPDQPNYFSLFIVAGVFFLAVAGGVVARLPIVRTLRVGGSLFAHPMNVLLALVVVSFLAMLVVGLTVDQFPCWIGVPNCD